MYFSNNILAITTTNAYVYMVFVYMQEDRNAYLLLQNQAEAYKQMQQQNIERQRLNALVRSHHSATVANNSTMMMKLEKPISPFTMTVRPVIPKVRNFLKSYHKMF